MSPEDEAWRRALLFEAVDFSISSNATPDFERDRGRNLSGAANTSGGSQSFGSAGSQIYGHEYTQGRGVSNMPSYSTLNSVSGVPNVYQPTHLPGAEPPRPRGAVATRDRGTTVTTLTSFSSY